MSLSEKHKAFCKALLKHSFNQTKAYQETYPKANKDTARNNASTLLAKTSTQEYLSVLTKKQDKEDLVTVEEVIKGIKQEITDAREDGQRSVSMKGFELLGKHLAMFTDKTINENHDTTELTFQDIAGKE